MTLQRRLLDWYAAHARRLPWRESPSPYRTWISEIMLQQTQVAAVLPYYARFLDRFPDVQALARAPLSEVLRYWSGLGFYRRARNLHQAARKIARDHHGAPRGARRPPRTTSGLGGGFPDTPEGLLALPGIGRYTAGAILSIAFRKPYPLVDGNVMRVFSRWFAIREDIKSPRTRKKMWELAQQLMDSVSKERGNTSKFGDWNQALMELGALICSPQSPRCMECPVESLCEARKKNLQEELPRTPSARKPVDVRWDCLWIERNGRVLLHKRSDSQKLLPGHWGLPDGRGNEELAAIRHAITHHRITLRLWRASPPERIQADERWVPRSELKNRLISSLWLKASTAALRPTARRSPVRASPSPRACPTAGLCGP